MTDASDKAPLYDRLGGEAGIAAYVDRFYEIMQGDPEAEPIWRMHTRDLDDLKARLRAFLAGFVGGPPVYPQLYGAPMMRARHLPFPIDIEARDLWMNCALRALADTVPDRDAALEFARGLANFANHMRNREG